MIDILVSLNCVGVLFCMMFLEVLYNRLVLRPQISKEEFKQFIVQRSQKMVEQRDAERMADDLWLLTFPQTKKR